MEDRVQVPVMPPEPLSGRVLAGLLVGLSHAALLESEVEYQHNTIIVNHDIKKTIPTASESFDIGKGTGKRAACYSCIIAISFFPDSHSYQ